jgi:lipopolysaccharide transport system permease protein
LAGADRFAIDRYESQKFDLAGFILASGQITERKRMAAWTKDLLSTRELIWAWTVRTIRGRYEQSFLGWFWAIVQPVATVAIFSLVFTRFVPVDTGDIPYAVFSYAAIVPWTLLASSLGDMSMSLVGNMNLVTKIYFPREALPIAAMVARFIDFLISAALMIVLMLLYRLPFFPIAVVYLPVILLIQIILILGIGLGVAALNVFYRDVDPMLRLFLQIWFYASPIIYPITMVPENLRLLYYLNPMAGIIQGYREVIFYGRMPGIELWIAAAVSVFILVLGYWFFRKVEYQFADVV